MECRTHIPAKDSTTAHTTSNAYLTPKPLNQIPDLPALKCQRFVKAARTVRTYGWASRAILTAPAEFPVGESGQAFFSASRMSAPAM